MALNDRRSPIVLVVVKLSFVGVYYFDFDVDCVVKQSVNKKKCQPGLNDIPYLYFTAVLTDILDAITGFFAYAKTRTQINCAVIHS